MARFELITYRETGLSLFEYKHTPEFGLVNPSPICMFLYEINFKLNDPESLENLRKLKTGDIVQVSMDLTGPGWDTWKPPPQFKNIPTQPLKLLFKIEDKRGSHVFVFDEVI